MPKAIYEGIYREIRSRIINGTYAFQEMLPTRGRADRGVCCTRNTVRRALSMLADQMFVQPIHGKGVRVIWLKGEPTCWAHSRKSSRLAICKAQQCRRIDRGQVF